MSVNCTKCGAVMSAGDSFCMECGTKLEASELESVQGNDGMACVICGFAMGAADKFCTNCGYVNEQAPIPEPEVSVPEPEVSVPEPEVSAPEPEVTTPEWCDSYEDEDPETELLGEVEPAEVIVYKCTKCDFVSMKSVLFCDVCGARVARVDGNKEPIVRKEYPRSWESTPQSEPEFNGNENDGFGHPPFEDMTRSSNTPVKQKPKKTGTGLLVISIILFLVVTACLGVSGYMYWKVYKENKEQELVTTAQQDELTAAETLVEELELELESLNASIDELLGSE